MDDAIITPAGFGFTFAKPSKTILIVTASGSIERHDIPIEQLSKDELLVVVRELVELLRKH